ncbi:MAG: hypothetical protein VB055_03765 [Oscillospiraceae bacterium]|nr:hypothetical protein [Oscillospiraceae bacterium]
MTASISAYFENPQAAHRAQAQLKSIGYRVSLGHQRPIHAALGGVCPGSGMPAHTHLENAVLLPDPDRAVLTVLVTDASAKDAADIILRCGGKTVH